MENEYSKAVEIATQLMKDSSEKNVELAVKCALMCVSFFYGGSSTIFFYENEIITEVNKIIA